ncbi:MAG TPA: DUF1592 domain-containing protein [Planctomycetaceae bacterium]|nr:DUF1592 domain-containing protein [Planctomycetaceae bacterium]
MPPEDEKQPESHEVQKLMRYIISGSQMARKHMDSTGHGTVLRRLNKTQYKNTIRDLLAFDTSSFDPTSEFPDDEEKENFKNIGHTLVTSDFWMVEQLRASKIILDKILVDLKKPVTRTQVIRPPFAMGKEADEKNPYTLDNVAEALKNIEKKKKQPFSVMFEATARKDGYMWAHSLHKGVSQSGHYGITFKVEAINQDYPFSEELVGIDKKDKHRAIVDVANSKNGSLSNIHHNQRKLLEVDLPNNQVVEIGCKFWLEKGESPRLSFPTGTFHIKELRRKFTMSKADFELLPPGVISEERTAKKWKAKEFQASQSRNKNKDHEPKKDYKFIAGWVDQKIFQEVYNKMGPVLRLYEMKVEGPLFEEWPTPAYKNLMGTKAPEEADPKQVLKTFAKQAYRGMYEVGDLEPVFAAMDREKKAGMDNRSLIRMGITAILCSPKFLYFNENEGELSQVALANRLSYFLWSSMPDAKLLQMAENGQLNSSAVLKEQAKRMIRDKRALSFFEGFPEDWLHLDNIGTLRPDRQQALIYYRENLEETMKKETFFFFTEMVLKNRPVTDFLDSDFTYMNRGLGKFYGLKDYRKLPLNGFKRITVKDPKRGGLLGQMAVLTATANGVDTSPIVRGIWVLENILGTPPAPPPANIPAVEPDTRGTVTIRDQLEKHRDVKTCSECHRKIDPAGWALENYDAIGQWRSRYDHTLDPIKREEKNRKFSSPMVNASGTFHSGESYEDILGFKKILLLKKDPFTRCLASKLLTYAAGRTMEPMDNTEINRIVDVVKSKGYGMQDLLLEVVSSNIFRIK